MKEDGVYFVSENAVVTISKLKKEKGKDIWVVGGEKKISFLMDNDLIDEMIITYIPVTLGKGIPLFSEEPDEDWMLKEEILYDNNSV